MAMTTCRVIVRFSSFFPPSLLISPEKSLQDDDSFFFRLYQDHESLSVVDKSLTLWICDAYVIYKTNVYRCQITSSIYGSRSYMKWRYGGVRHGTSAGKRRDIAFGVLALLG